jgi:soluble lytic murein transglycosylase-like protein
MVGRKLSHEEILYVASVYAQLYGISPALVLAVIRAESNFNANAVSSKGAKGLMQLMPDTAAGVGVTNPFDPIQNIAGGSVYLAQQLRTFWGKVSLAVAAYNAGPQAVRSCGGIPQSPETQEFVRRVTRYFQEYETWLGHG